jgi:hypothetical protein
MSWAKYGIPIPRATCLRSLLAVKSC